jgi:hypothetical protein
VPSLLPHRHSNHQPTLRPPDCFSRRLTIPLRRSHLRGNQGLLHLRRGGILLAYRLGRRGRLRRVLVPPRHLWPLLPLRMRAGRLIHVDGPVDASGRIVQEVGLLQEGSMIGGG